MSKQSLEDTNTSMLINDIIDDINSKIKIDRENEYNYVYNLVTKNVDSFISDKEGLKKQLTYHLTDKDNMLIKYLGGDDCSGYYFVTTLDTFSISSLKWNDLKKLSKKINSKYEKDGFGVEFHRKIQDREAKKPIFQINLEVYLTHEQARKFHEIYHDIHNDGRSQ